VGLNFEVVHISDSWKEHYGPFFNEAVGTNILENFPSLASSWKSDFEKCFLGYSTAPARDSLFFNGKTLWLEWILSPWFDEDENVIGAIIQVEDVSEMVKVQQELSKLKILVDVKAEIAKIGSWEFNAVTDELYWNTMTKILHEVPLDFEPNMKTAIDFYKPGDSQLKITECVNRSIKNGEPWKEKLQLTTAKNNDIWVMATGKPLFQNNTLIGIIGTFQDITEEVLAAQKTKENEQLLKTLIDHLPLNVFVKDLNSRKIVVNKAECDYIGKPYNEIIGKDDFELYDEKVAQISREEDLSVIKTLVPILGAETTNTKLNGEKTTFLTSKIPLTDEHNCVKGIIGFSLDISQIKQKEEQLTRLVNISNLQNKKLVDFAHIISHNLRSHTANFSMLLGFLIKEKNEVERDNLLQMLMNSSDNLLETLDNLNEVVAINSTKVLEKNSINLSITTSSILNNLKHLIKSKNASITNLIPTDLFVKGLPAYIENILQNVISNAIKFAKSDSPHEVRLSAEKSSGYVVITVKDNGSGIDLEKNKNKIFGMYKTFHEQPNSRGIGLYIAKNQIEAMNGKFKIDSTLGLGTTFKIYLDDCN
tara:strand:+ start:26471 stop:28246 length:1776 start_codon:yes stop_codon:yes gene_type:complete